MGSLLPILINSVLGGGGGLLGNMIKRNGLGQIGNIIAGIIGGNGLAAGIGSSGLMDGLMSGGDTSSMVAGGLSALLGGGAGSLIGGLFKKAPDA